MTDREIAATSPPELADLPRNFWAEAEVVEPIAKTPISLRVDEDVLAWFRKQGPRYQSRMNAVLRSFMLAKDAPLSAPPGAESPRRGLALGAGGLEGRRLIRS